MCNLFKQRASAAEIGALFRARPPAAAPNLTGEIYPGGPGLVVTEAAGERAVSAMTWGFPLKLAGMKPGSKPRPVNNCADLAKPMWVGLARKPQWRCLIPPTEFAEAEGPAGAKTRTWFRIKGQPIAAWAGLVTGLTARFAGRVLGRLWWPIHKVAAGLLALVWAHSVLAGSDVVALRGFYLATGCAVVGLAITRYAARTPADRVSALAQDLQETAATRQLPVVARAARR